MWKIIHKEDISNDSDFFEHNANMHLLYKTNSIFIQAAHSKIILPVHSKYLLFLNKLIQELFIQKYFIREQCTPEEKDKLLAFLMNHFSCGSISLDAEISTPTQVHVAQKTNFVIPIQSDYEQIYSRFNTHHRRAIAKSDHLEYSENMGVADFIDFYFSNRNQNIQKKILDRQFFEKLIHFHLQHDSGFISNISAGSCLAACFFIRDKHRIVYLIPVSSSEGMRSHAMAQLINQVIKRNSNSNLIFDFEGSELPGVRQFIQGFSPQSQVYYNYQWNNHPICKWTRTLKKI